MYKIILFLSTFLVYGCDSSQEGDLSNSVEKAPQSIQQDKVQEVKPVIPEPVIPGSMPAPVTSEAEKVIDRGEKPEKNSLSGEQVYNQSCQNCHATGAAGSPKLGDAAQWKSRIEKGMDVLYVSAIKGVPSTAMMPKGTCNKCSDEELRAAVDFMIAKITTN